MEQHFYYCFVSNSNNFGIFLAPYNNYSSIGNESIYYKLDNLPS